LPDDAPEWPEKQFASGKGAPNSAINKNHLHLSIANRLHLGNIA
jgi:hypothetical protein